MEIPSPCQPWTLYFVYDYDLCNCKLLSVECKERRATFCSVLIWVGSHQVRVEDDDGKEQPSHGKESDSLDGNVRGREGRQLLLATRWISLQSWGSLLPQTREPLHPCPCPMLLTTNILILDENVKAQSHLFYSIAAFKVSPNHKLVAYAEDTKGDEIYTIYVIDARTGALVDKPLVGVTASRSWMGY